MAKEKCWKCKKLKNNVKLRACDDRQCDDCYEENKGALRKLRGGVASTTKSPSASAAIMIHRFCEMFCGLSNKKAQLTQRERATAVHV